MLGKDKNNVGRRMKNVCQKNVVTISKMLMKKDYKCSRKNVVTFPKNVDEKNVCNTSKNVNEKY
jgi:hypothetical protein